MHVLVGLGVLVIPTTTVGVACCFLSVNSRVLEDHSYEEPLTVTNTVEGATLVRLIVLWTATFTPEITILH